MTRLLLNTVIVALAVVFVAGQQPKPEIIINTVVITVKPDNPYFKDWEGVVQPGGQVISVSLPVLQDLPDNALMSTKINLSGQTVIDFVSTICDALDDESFGKQIVKYAEPKGEFPEECPFVKGGSFKINKYEIPNDKLPQNTQPGEFHAEIKIYTASEDDPEVFLVADGEIILR